jgi:hypothetical protein
MTIAQLVQIGRLGLLFKHLYSGGGGLDLKTESVHHCNQARINLDNTEHHINSTFNEGILFLIIWKWVLSSVKSKAPIESVAKAR